jgi:twinkle protein
MASETTALPARNAPQGERKSKTDVSASRSTQTGQSGIAGTADGAGVSAAGIVYARSRGIRLETLLKLGVKSGTAAFADGKREALFWPYVLAGEVVNWKATSIEGKAFTGMPGGQMSLHHQDDLGENVIIVEGEWDMAALVQAGVPIEGVTTVPNGAGSGCGYLQDCDWWPKHVTLATDADEPGLALRKALAHIFGPAVCSFVDWPEGCKDANDMLRSDGPEAVFDLVMNGTFPWPVEGLYRLNELPEPQPMVTWNPGFPEWEGKVMLSPGCLSVVTGFPGHGKTQMWAQLWQQVAFQYDINICMASFETRAKPHHRRTLRSLLNRCSEKDMNENQKRNADQWINEHYLWLQKPDQMPTLDWLLDAAEVAVVRHGAKVLQIDPWNRLEHQRDSRQSETDFIGHCLTRLYTFAQDLDCHVQVLAHPAKRDGKRRDLPPTLEDISGSSHWNNRPDQGFVVHREKLFNQGVRQTEATLLHLKARFDDLGYPCSLDLRFDPLTSRYDSIDFETKLERDMA